MGKGKISYEDIRRTNHNQPDEISLSWKRRVDALSLGWIGYILLQFSSDPGEFANFWFFKATILFFEFNSLFSVHKVNHNRH